MKTEQTTTFVFIRFQSVQNLKTATPARWNNREWWKRVYREFRIRRDHVASPNKASETTIFDPQGKYQTTVYGPCGLLP